MCMLMIGKVANPNGCGQAFSRQKHCGNFPMGGTLQTRTGAARHLADSACSIAPEAEKSKRLREAERPSTEEFFEGAKEGQIRPFFLCSRFWSHARGYTRACHRRSLSRLSF